MLLNRRLLPLASEPQKKKLKRQYAEKLEEFLDSNASPKLKDLVCRKIKEIDRDLQRSEVR